MVKRFFEFLKLFLTRKHFSVSPKSFIKSLNSFSFHSRGKWETQIIKSEAVYFASRCHPRAIIGFNPRILPTQSFKYGQLVVKKPCLSLWDQFRWCTGQLQPHLQIQPKIISVSNTFSTFSEEMIAKTGNHRLNCPKIWPASADRPSRSDDRPGQPGRWTGDLPCKIRYFCQCVLSQYDTSSVMHRFLLFWCVQENSEIQK